MNLPPAWHPLLTPLSWPTCWFSTPGGTLAYLFSAQDKACSAAPRGPIYTLEPVFALFLARAILAELRPRQLSGCALVVAALIMGVVSANRSALRCNPARGRPPAAL